MDGIDRFSEAMSRFSDCYVIIGGTACVLEMQDSPLVRPRATHDIDMIVVVERISEEFVK